MDSEVRQLLPKPGAGAEGVTILHGGKAAKPSSP